MAAPDGRDAAVRAEAVLAELASLGSEETRAGMARYGIETGGAFGVSIYQLRPIARGLGRDHELALALWATGNHEARLLASMVDDPASVTPGQMDAWAAEFDSWDVCDQVTSNLFDKTPYAWDKVREWSAARDQWVKRAAFATAAALACRTSGRPTSPFSRSWSSVAARPGTTATS
ncbi:MAG: DNA alkylation repair protein [Deltaproteobacteria bacterium]